MHGQVAHLAGAIGGVLRVKKKAWHYVYLARARDGAYYCGYALDPLARIAAHNSGKGAKALRGRKPVTLAFTKRFSNHGDALRFEVALKALSHSRKMQLARCWLLKAPKRSRPPP